MRIGVTGGAGFIGTWVVEELISRGHEPLVFDHLGRSSNNDIDTMLGDVRDNIAMTELAAHVEGIIHLAAVLGTQETIKNPRPAVLSNIEGGLNFLEAIAQYDLPGVYIGVGNHWMENSYSISKTTIERFVTMFNKERNTRVNTVRVVNAYGPHQRVAPPFGPGRVRKITPAFICRALSGMPVEVYGDGQQISDMVYVADVASGLVSALEEAAKGNVLPKIVEIGPAVHHSVQEIAEYIIELCVNSGYNKVPIVNLPMRPGEIPGARVTADTSTLELVGMKVEELTPLIEGMSNTIDYFINSRGKEWHQPK